MGKAYTAGQVVDHMRGIAVPVLHERKCRRLIRRPWKGEATFLWTESRRCHFTSSNTPSLYLCFAVGRCAEVHFRRSEPHILGARIKKMLPRIISYIYIT